MYLDSPEVAELAGEKSVRGCVVRLALERAAAADADQKMLLSDALQELLARFDSRGRGAA